MIPVAALLGCSAPTEPPLPMRPQTVVLLATPKIISDFSDPGADVERFLRNYEPLTSRASETIVIFAVGNSDHILTYRGTDHWNDAVAWARYTDGEPVSDRVLDYQQIEGIVRTFKSRAMAMGMQLKVFDQVDPGNEFAENPFKYSRHPECMDFRWESYDIRGRLKQDALIYASAPQGIAEGTPCGEFLVDQVSRYVRDLGFDGMLYGNQFGTRGRWLPDNGPGYSAAEAKAIREFLEYSKRALGDRELMWFDSYNNVQIERSTFSFPTDGYGYFDYLIASGFCVITFPDRYLDNLRSKTGIVGPPRVLATLDYVDPWYSYNSMKDYPSESVGLEDIALDFRVRIDGIMFFANNEKGELVPRTIIESFANRFFCDVRAKARTSSRGPCGLSLLE